MSLRETRFVKNAIFTLLRRFCPKVTVRPPSPRPMFGSDSGTTVQHDIYGGITVLSSNDVGFTVQRIISCVTYMVKNEQRNLLEVVIMSSIIKLKSYYLHDKDELF